MSFGYKCPSNRKGQERLETRQRLRPGAGHSYFMSVRWTLTHCTIMLSPPAVEHDSDVCGLETGGNQASSGANVQLQRWPTCWRKQRRPGFTGESVWPHPTSGRYASVMRSVQIRGRSGEQKMMSVGRLSVGCAGEKSPLPPTPLHVRKCVALTESFMAESAAGVEIRFLLLLIASPQWNSFTEH